MEYGINIGYFLNSADMKTAARLVSAAGFTRLDYTPPLKDENWRARMIEDLKIFDAYGLSVHQTHAPFNRYGNYGDRFSVCLERCAEATEYMGAKYMVAHADEFDFDKLAFSPEAAFDYNYKIFAPLVEGAAARGFKIAFETVFEDGYKGRRFTSREEELIGFIKAFNSEMAVCCWDFGHSNVSFGKDAPNVARRLGSLIECVHLHDNTGVDAHSMPLSADINWENTMRAFSDIGYSGVMSVEYAHGVIPPPLLGDYINLTYKMARQLEAM